MTRVVIIEPEEDQPCSQCGAVEECRPYGKGGALICFSCGQKDPKETERQFLKVLTGEEPPTEH